MTPALAVQWLISIPKFEQCDNSTQFSFIVKQKVHDLSKKNIQKCVSPTKLSIYVQNPKKPAYYSDVINGAMASQITSLMIVPSTVYKGADLRKHQSSTSLAFVRRIHRWPVNVPRKWPVTRKMFPFDDVIMPLRATCRYDDCLSIS